MLGFLPQVILLSDGWMGVGDAHETGRWRDQEGEKEKHGDIENERETKRDREDGQRERKSGSRRGR